MLGFNYLIVLDVILWVILLISMLGILCGINLRGRVSKTRFRKQKQKYLKTGLSTEFSLELKCQLEHLMVADKPFLEHSLSLDDIANLLSIPRHHASQIINEHFHMNFFSFVNSYRIKEAEEILKSKRCYCNRTIEDIAYQCGFNNKVSFYRAFKERTNSTPKVFRSQFIE